MQTIGDRVKYARENILNVSQIELAKRLGIAQPSLHQIEIGKTVQPRNIDKIVDVLGVSKKWLLLGEGFPSEKATSNMGKLMPLEGRIPLISWEQAGDWYNIKEEIVLDKNTIFLSIEKDRANNCFGLKIENDSMEASHGMSFAPGSIIVIDPELQVKSGDYVIAKLPDHKEVTFKKYVKDAGKEWLIPLNGRYPSIEITAEIKILGVIIESRQQVKRGDNNK